MIDGVIFIEGIARSLIYKGQYRSLSNLIFHKFVSSHPSIIQQVFC